MSCFLQPLFLLKSWFEGFCTVELVWGEALRGVKQYQVHGCKLYAVLLKVIQPHVT